MLIIVDEDEEALPEQLPRPRCQDVDENDHDTVGAPLFEAFLSPKSVILVYF